MRTFSIFTALLLLLFAFSCSRAVGYLVVVWPPDESDLGYGELVRVISQSELRNIFVIEKAGSRVREEVPRPIGKFFDRRRDAERFAAEFKPYINMFAFTETALNVRRLPDANSERVYRLRPGQVVKIVSKSQTPSVVGHLTGYWTEVMTESGVIGYSFGSFLTFFTRDTSLSRQEHEQQLLDSFFNNTWYPTVYADIINSGNIVIESLQTGEGLFPDRANNRIVIQTQRERIEFNFTDISFEGSNTVAFLGTPLEIILYSTERIYVSYTHRGVNHLAFYTTLEMPLERYIEEEVLRRIAVLDRFYARGRNLTSDLYGTISLGDRRRFTWTGYLNLVPDVFPFGFGSTGTVQSNYFLASRLARRFDGVITFAFDSPGREIVFAYLFVDDAVRFTHIPERNIERGIVTSIPAEPRVIYFRQSSLPR
ncbi:MAG: SH3 domain-containing protein [Spirochaetes bacterium]|nr:SH3 domain-containing protein [Spirochaetota bacterium]